LVFDGISGDGFSENYSEAQIADWIAMDFILDVAAMRLMGSCLAMYP